MANIDPAACRNLADEYASGAPGVLRRHWADVAYARRKRTFFSKRCLPAAYEIPLYVHWVLPPGADESRWVDWGRFNTSINMARDKLAIMGASLVFKQGQIWKGSLAADISAGMIPYTDLTYLGWAAAAKRAVNGLEGRNLRALPISLSRR